MLSKLNLFPFKIQDLYSFKFPKLNFATKKRLEADYKKEMERQPQLWKSYESLLSNFPKLPQTSKKFEIGIEVEVENAPILVLPGWTTIEEGSLRNKGKEYITCPIEHLAIPVVLSSLYANLLNWTDNKENPVDFSWRTSVHIHLNVRNFMIEEVFKLFLFYIIFEKVLFKFAGSQREQSIFCVPFRQSVLMAALSGFCDGEYNIGFLQKSWAKYSAINLSRLDDYGTIEFRHLPGTSDVNKVGNWIGLILCLAEAASTHSMEEIIKSISSLNTTSKFDLFATTVFKPPLNKLLVAETTKEYEEGITACKEVLETSTRITALKGSAMEKIIKEKEESKLTKSQIKPLKLN